MQLLVSRISTPKKDGLLNVEKHSKLGFESVNIGTPEVMGSNPTVRLLLLKYCTLEKMNILSWIILSFLTRMISILIIIDVQTVSYCKREAGSYIILNIMILPSLEDVLSTHEP